MWSERPSPGAVSDGIGLSLEELVAIQPHHLRGGLAPGQRMPGGERVGKGRAQSLEFDGISPYAAGDDVRWIDWRATARSGQVQVKRFAAQSHRARVMVCDLHAGLYFGTKTRLMAKTAALATARLSWEALAINEPVGLVVPGHEPVQPRRGRRHLLRTLDWLRACYDGQGASVGGIGSDLAEAVAAAASMVRKGDEICVVSDFAEPLEPLLDATASLAEIRVLHAYVVEDPLMRAALPAGRYPARRLEGEQRHAFVVSAAESAASLGTVERLQAERRRQFYDRGWRVTDALSLLPAARAGAGASAP